MKQDFTILFSPNETDRQAAPQFAAGGFVANAAIEAGANDVQLGFAHGAFQAQQQTIVKQRRVIDSIIVADQCVGDAAEFQQAIPVGVVASQARDLQAQNDTHAGQCDFAGQASKAGALVGAGAGQSEVFIDDDNLFFGPPQLAGSVS